LNLGQFWGGKRLISTDRTKEGLDDDLLEIRHELAELRRELMELRSQVAEMKKSGLQVAPVDNRKTVRVGEILIEMGYLTELQLGRALKEQKEADMRGDSHLPVGKILAQKGVITQEQLEIALSEQRKRLGH
jgi:hypothetical protein